MRVPRKHGVTVTAVAIYTLLFLMGLLLSLPLAGIGTSCLTGIAFCFTSTAGKSEFQALELNTEGCLSSIPIL